MAGRSARLGGSSILEAIGVSPIEEGVYLAVLGRPRLSLADAAATTGLSRRRLRKVLFELEEKGLVSAVPGKPLRFLPAPPDLAVEGLIHRRLEEVEHARLAASAMAEEFRGTLQRDNPVHLVEVVTGIDAVRLRSVQLQRSANEEIVALSTPPYASVPGPQEVEAEALRRGVRYRVIYDRSALEAPGLLAGLQFHTKAGEDARVLRNLRVKLLIADQRLGLVPLGAAKPTLGGAAVVHSSPLLDALTMLFEALWERAVPVRFSGTTATMPESAADLSLEDHKLIRLVAAGLTDEAVAHELDLGVRTVRRRIARIMKQLGASTRFQAGMQAVRRSYL